MFFKCTLLVDKKYAKSSDLRQVTCASDLNVPSSFKRICEDN